MFTSKKNYSGDRMPEIKDLPRELQELRSFLPDLVRYAEHERRLPYASVLVTHREGMDALYRGKTERVQPVPAQSGVCVTIFDGLTFYSLATDRMDRDHLMQAVTDFCDGITPQEGGHEIDPGEPTDQHFMTAAEVDPLSITPTERLGVVRSIVEQLEGYDPKIVDATVRYRGLHDVRMFANRDRLLSQNNRIADILMMATARDGDRMATNHDRVTGSGHEISRLDPNLVPSIASWTLRHLYAEEIEPGSYTVVLDSDMSGILAHEAFGHGCEADTIARGASRAAKYVGKRVGSDLVTIADYAGLPGTHGSFFFSDEGVLVTEPTLLVNKGILQPTFLTDRYSYMALKDRVPGLRLSPNGRREDYRRPVFARMSTTYFLPPPEGGMGFEEMVADVKNGLLIEVASNGMEDPLGWGLQLEALRARPIKNGKIGDTVHHPIGLTGYVPDVLESIDAVGPNIVIPGDGHCGKGHKEIVRVASGGPYLRCRMEVG